MPAPYFPFIEDKFMLQEKVVVVTGAANGIGRAAAMALAAQGARVGVNDLSLSLDGTSSVGQRAQQVVDEIRQAGGEAVANGDSVSEYTSAQRIIEPAIDTYGRVDAVVNNAGIVRDKMFHRLTPEDFDAVVKVHLYGTFNLCHASAEHFRRQGGGSLINMTSNSAVIGNRGQANYCAAKLGIVGLSKAIALDMAAFNVRSNCIAPLAWSRMTETIPSKTAEQARHVEKIRSMGPETIAPLICYLAPPPPPAPHPARPPPHHPTPPPAGWCRPRPLSSPPGPPPPRLFAWDPV